MLFRALPPSAGSTSQFCCRSFLMTKDCALRRFVLKRCRFMATGPFPESLQPLEIPGHITFARGKGELPKIDIATGRSTAEIYLHGAHVTGFQKNGEPPLLFISARSHFAPGQPIRGGVPICFPWFGNRDNEPSHGFARVCEWQLVKTSGAPAGTVTLTFALPL